MLDLSSLMPRKETGWYELHLHNYKDMQVYQREAHLHSMKHSQGVEYNRRLRLVLTEQDMPVKGGDPWKIETYQVPSLQTAVALVDQVVIRREGKEFIAKGVDGKTGFSGGVVTDLPEGTTTGRFSGTIPSLSNRPRTKLDI
jgi:hypothetical protein